MHHQPPPLAREPALTSLPFPSFPGLALRPLPFPMPPFLCCPTCRRCRGGGRAHQGPVCAALHAAGAGEEEAGGAAGGAAGGCWPRGGCWDCGCLAVGAIAVCYLVGWKRSRPRSRWVLGSSPWLISHLQICGICMGSWVGCLCGCMAGWSHLSLGSNAMNAPNVCSTALLESIAYPSRRRWRSWRVEYASQPLPAVLPAAWPSLALGWTSGHRCAPGIAVLAQRLAVVVFGVQPVGSSRIGIGERPSHRLGIFAHRLMSASWRPLLLGCSLSMAAAVMSWEGATHS